MEDGGLRCAEASSREGTSARPVQCERGRRAEFEYLCLGAYTSVGLTGSGFDCLEVPFRCDHIGSAKSLGSLPEHLLFGRRMHVGEVSLRASPIHYILWSECAAPATLLPG